MRWTVLSIVTTMSAEAAPAGGRLSNAAATATTALDRSIAGSQPCAAAQFYLNFATRNRPCKVSPACVIKVGITRGICASMTSSFDVLTIGHFNQSVDNFMSLLKNARVTAIADVR